jgi:hypothetical protein
LSASESIAENSELNGSLLEVVEEAEAEAEVVDDVAELVDEAVDEAETSDCCCTCINTPRIILERLAVLLPVRPPSVAAVVLEVLLVDWVELELVELVDDVEVDSSRERRLDSIWDAFPLDEPIPAMDMMGSPFDCFGHGPGYPAKAGGVPVMTGRNGGGRRHTTVPLTDGIQSQHLLPRWENPAYPFLPYIPPVFVRWRPLRMADLVRIVTISPCTTESSSLSPYFRVMTES